MKKFISFAVILLFVSYVLYQKFGMQKTPVILPSDQTISSGQNSSGQTDQNNSTDNSGQDLSNTANNNTSNNSDSGSSSKSTSGSTSSNSNTTSPKTGIFKDGQFTGNVEDAFYGNVQVVANITSGKIADVKFLQFPDDRSTSTEINIQAMPVLRSEAISAQSSKVDIVSGATFTSQAYIKSLASALNKAKN